MGNESNAYDQSVHEMIPDQRIKTMTADARSTAVTKTNVHDELRNGQCYYYPEGEGNKVKSCRFSHSKVADSHAQVFQYFGAGGVRRRFGKGW